ncbi:Phenylacetaldehyde synthase [Linum grandiflorum]
MGRQQARLALNDLPLLSSPRAPTCQHLAAKVQYLLEFLFEICKCNTLLADFPLGLTPSIWQAFLFSAAVGSLGSWITSPAATELEMIVLDWLCKLLKLSEGFLSSGN